MARIGLAFWAFFKTLFNSEVAVRIADVRQGADVAVSAEKSAVLREGAHSHEGLPARELALPREGATPQKPARSDAIDLLAALQREARLVDFIKEPIASYTDAQIGAAVRDVHRDSAAVLERLLAIRPLDERDESASVEIPAGYDAGKIRLSGAASGNGPFRGTLRHAGWQVTHIQLPQWTGNAASANVIAPADVEIA